VGFVDEQHKTVFFVDTYIYKGIFKETQDTSSIKRWSHMGNTAVVMQWQ